MSCRLIASIGALAVMLAAPLAGQAPKAAPAAKAKSVPRTPDGHPDLQGIWTNATITPMERPAALAGKPTLTDAEAAALEKSSAKELADVDGKSEAPLLAAAGSNGTGGYNVLFIDRGSEFARVDGVKRTSLIVDPPDGKAPPITEEARQRNAAAMMRNVRFDSVSQRPLAERCLLGFGSTSGPPMLPVLYNNNYQIVQTPEHVMILVEMVHDARIVRMNGTHPSKEVRQWLGDSIGHWEGDTLVVDTTNFSDKVSFRGSSENLHIIERFTRTDANTILYRVTIDDPTTFSKIWTLEYPFVATPGPIYEYACHEGNYAMTDILGGARKADAEAGKK
ncbi:MAG TPA: hypothetical protein VGZ73_19830 [Bryobacteraceae bacterium]|jgi:hypothetical protein|nr:hypothetical protein [Bryobacteraceae bacterium]